MDLMEAKVIQINAKAAVSGERGLPKKAVQSSFVKFSGLQGDFNRYRTEKLNNERDSAVLLICSETLEAISKPEFPVQPGHLGENFTIRGLSPQSLKEGVRLALGESVQVEISRACDPCSNLQALPYVGRDRVTQFMKLLMGRRGWYARVLQEGLVRTGDPVRLI
jgi:MOSC domain-containing protein YiiM